MILYLDTSALVKRYFKEPHSNDLLSKWKEATVNLAKENGFPVQNFEQVTQDMAFKLVPVLEKLSYK